MPATIPYRNVEHIVEHSTRRLFNPIMRRKTLLLFRHAAPTAYRPSSIQLNLPINAEPEQSIPPRHTHWLSFFFFFFSLLSQIPPSELPSTHPTNFQVSVHPLRARLFRGSLPIFPLILSLASLTDSLPSRPHPCLSHGSATGLSSPDNEAASKRRMSSETLNATCALILPLCTPLNPFNSHGSSDTVVPPTDIKSSSRSRLSRSLDIDSSIRRRASRTLSVSAPRFNYDPRRGRCCVEAGRRLEKVPALEEAVAFDLKGNLDTAKYGSSGFGSSTVSGTCT